MTHDERDAKGHADFYAEQMRRTLLNEHDARILAEKNKPVSSPAVLAEFHRSHWFCQMCGRAGEWTAHHIIGGRGGRSDEFCNLLYCCWLPCHAFADLAKNLGIILSMKMRTGELDEAGLKRLEQLHGRRLPERRPIPEFFDKLFRANRPEFR